MKAELYYQSYSGPLLSLDVSTIEEDDDEDESRIKIIEAEIYKQKTRFKAYSGIGKFLPGPGEERKPISINKFTIEINGERFIPEEEIQIYFYKDEVEILDNVRLIPEEVD